MLVKRILSEFRQLQDLRKSAITFFVIMPLLVLASPQPAVAQEDLPIGARSLAMGATYVALANNADAVFLNPGGLSQITGTELSFFYQKPFGLKDLNFGTAAATFPLGNYRVGVGFLSMGNGLYDQTEIALALSHHLGNTLYYGAALRYQSVRIESFGSAGALGLGFGAVIPITESLRWGFQVRNLNRSALGQSEEKVPQIFKGGLAVFPGPGMILTLEIFKEVGLTEEVRFGTELSPLPHLALRAGTASNPNRFSGGFGVNMEAFKVDYAFFTHNDLGLTHQVSFSIHLGKRKDRRRAQIRNRSHLESQDAGGQEADSPLDINTATAAELIKLPGIGPKTAADILSYRRRNGLFTQIETLQRVPGIGPQKLETIRPYITIREQH